MAGHSLLNQVLMKTEAISVDGETYNVALSYNRIAGIDGLVVGLKFTDANGSMDSSLAKYPSNPFRLAKAVAHRAVQMIKPDLESISILGFYLLTHDLDSRRADGGKIKKRLYGSKALMIHSEVKHKLQYLTTFDVQGGVGWAMSIHPHKTYPQFNIFENELAKHIEAAVC